jgi:outer membrane receptor for ferrienterochelin and colicin
MHKVSFLLICSILLSASAHGQRTEKADTLKMDNLLDLSFEDLMNISVITPSKNAQTSGQAPATVVVVTRQQIELRGYRTLAEILNDLPDFTVNDKTDPQFYNVIGARGIFRQDYFAILLDGVRISSPTNEPLPMLENFPIYLAQQVEVVYGPGSALYGADAMAGVINIITQKPADRRNASINAVGGTQGYMNTSAVFSKTLKNDFNLSVAGQYSYDAQPDFSKIYKNEYDMTSHKTGVFNTSYGPITVKNPVNENYEAPVKTYNAYASVSKGDFSMNILHHYVAVPTSTTLTPDNGIYNKDVFYGHGMTTASTNYTTHIGKLRSASTLVASFYKVNPRSNFRNLYDGMEPGYKYSTGSMIKAEEQVDYTLSDKLNITGGLSYEIFQSVPKTPELQSPISRTGSLSAILLNSVSENNPAGIQAKLFPLAYTNVGSYLQAQYFPAKQFSLTAGVRYDNNSRFGSTINPRVGLVFNPFEKTTLKALYGTAYWAPSPLISFESYGSFYTLDGGNTYRSDFWHLPNPGLKPVTSSTFELSLLQKISQQLNVSVTAYATQVDNLIVDVPDNGNTNLYNNNFLGWDVSYITVPYNKGLQTNYGGNASVNGTFKIGRAEFNAWSSISYLDGRESNGLDTGEERPQGQVVPWQFRAGLDAKINAFHFSVRLLKTSVQRTSVFLAEDPQPNESLPGYSLLNATAGYKFRDRATFFVNVYNALDQRYLHPLGWDSPDFAGSYQNPLRALAGIRLSR